jgi:ribonuclease HII
MPVGVDEAGKGPVLGSMFAAAVRCVPGALPDGVGDSKTIPAERRRRLADEIRAVARVGVAEIPVERIDDPTSDMHTLTVAAHTDALADVLEDGVACTLDAGDADADRFGRRVAQRLPYDASVTAEHGADETDPLVGAASIVAKVARDAHVAEIARTYGDVGSGYPSDPTTRSFLREYVEDHGTLPPCARSSWSTCEDLLAAREQSALGEF